MEIIELPKSILIECKLCGCRISVNHDDWVNVINGNTVQCFPCCKENNFIKIGQTY